MTSGEIMKIDVSYYSSRGSRKNNEDYLAVLKRNDNMIFTIADGLGGHDCGEIASKLSVNTLLSNLKNVEFTFESINNAITNANRVISSKNKLNCMKSTLALLCINNGKAFAANVGDTRIYQFRNSGIIFQSTDHSVAQMAVMVGEITNSQIRSHTERNKLIKALGSDIEIQPDISSLSIEQGDAFLICSDGFWENIFEQEMCDLLFIAKNSKDWLEKMRKHVNARMSKDCDNNSAIAIMIDEEQES